MARNDDIFSTNEYFWDMLGKEPAEGEGEVTISDEVWEMIMGEEKVDMEELVRQQKELMEDCEHDHVSEMRRRAGFAVAKFWIDTDGPGQFLNILEEGMRREVFDGSRKVEKDRIQAAVNATAVCSQAFDASHAAKHGYINYYPGLCR